MMRWLRRLLIWTILVGIGVAMLALLQHKLIYHPRSYGPEYRRLFESRLRKVNYQTAEGRQTAFYLGPEDTNKPPELLWMVYGGNAALALDWMWLVQNESLRNAGFLLIDYPGFGECEGSASPGSIDASSEAAYSQWSITYLDEESAGHHPLLAILGHSLGAAAGMRFTTKHFVQKVVLISPFTSVADMVKDMFGAWLIPLLRHRFDNLGPLRELLKQNPPPEIHIFHGSRDEVIPVKMGRELAALDTKLIRYHEIEGGYHNTILQDALGEILASMSTHHVD